jgi:(p)ppGpp synthase/HD superfamily hydrolase
MSQRAHTWVARRRHSRDAGHTAQGALREPTRWLHGPGRCPGRSVGMTADDALAVARRWHGDVSDKLGEDYVTGHLSRVQRTVASRGGDLVTQIAAALHDTLEDTDATAEALAAEGVPAEAIRIVEIVTRRHGESYQEFIERIAVSGDPRAIMLKLADLHDNTDPAR